MPMSTPVDKLNRPDYKCAAYEKMLPAVTLCRDVAGGTASMRKAGRTYLPQNPAETDSAYSNRLAKSVFYNVFRKTREAFVGMVLKSPPKLSEEDVPETIRDHWENIDLCGSHGDVFVKELFSDALNDGHAFVLVDMQQALPRGATLADERKAGLRPYWVKYTKKQALNWRSSTLRGEQVLTQITFEECATEDEGDYGEKEVLRYRTFRLDVSTGLVQWSLKRKEKGADGKDVFVDAGSGETTLARIPVAVVYGRKTGFFESEPPLLDVAYENIRHYQKLSDLDNIEHVANVPILTRKGATEEQRKQSVTVGSNALFDVPENGDLKYTEHEGKAVGALRQSILDCEQRMAVLGLSIMSQRADSNITATEKRMDQGERVSELSSIARSLKDCIESCLGFHAQYLGLADENGDGGSVELGVSEDDLVIDSTTLTLVYKMFVEGSLSEETLYTVFGRALKVDLSDEPDAVKIRNLTAIRGAVANTPQGITQLYQARSSQNQPQGAVA